METSQVLYRVPLKLAKMNYRLVKRIAYRRLLLPGAAIRYPTIRVFQTHGAASFDHWCDIHSVAPSAGSNAVRTPTGFAIEAKFLSASQVYGCVPAASVMGPLRVFTGSAAR